MKQELLETEEFYNLMQDYRNAAPTDQDKVVRCFDNVKSYVKSNSATAIGWADELAGMLKDAQTAIKAQQTKCKAIVNEDATFAQGLEFGKIDGLQDWYNYIKSNKGLDN